MLIPSKLSRPVRLDHTVVRERLLAKLSGANNFRLALITSPAGYGKTTLISQWAAGSGFENVGTYMIVGLVGLNFVFELVVDIVLSPIVVRLINIGKKGKAA